MNFFYSINIKFVLLCFISLALAPIGMAQENKVESSQTEEETTVFGTYPVTHDTYIRGGGSGSENYGDETELLIKNTTSLDFARQIMLQFDLSSVDFTGVIINKAVLRLYSTGNNARPITASVMGDDWDESTVTWDNAPVVGRVITQMMVDASDQYFEWDISSYIYEQLAGDKVVSLSINDAEPVKKSVSFASKELGSNAPQLVLYSGEIEKPAAPESLLVESFSTSIINLSWADMSYNEEGFLIERKQGEEAFSELVRVGFSVSTYRDEGLTKDTTYIYRISAYNEAGYSDYSDELTAKTHSGVYSDNPPGNIINTADYTYWRELAETVPMYATMKASALSNNSSETRDVMGANALAYILDPENRANYIANIQDKFVSRIQTMNIGTGAATSSVPSHELFYALLALDVIRYDLDATVLAEYEGWLEDKIFQLVLGQWDPHAWAMRMLYYKFAGDDANFQVAKEEFELGLSEHYMPNDGVSPAGNGYCVQRWNSIERSAKNTTLNILEYMGYNEYYTNPGIIGLKEFMYGYAVAPFGRILLYGDSRDTEGQEAWDISDNTILSPHIVSAARFSPEAYKYAMWVLREGAGKTDIDLIGHLSGYLIMAGTAEDNKPLNFDTDDAELAPSRLFKHYGALISAEQSTDVLYMSMLNLTGNTEYHTHYETNAIAMAGYGEILMRNAGYDGPGNDVTIDGVTATFDFMHSNSESSNTLMIGGVKHSERIGDGITEGIVGQELEYFRGQNSKSVNGTHFRDVVFLQPSDGANGYYLVMDHVSTDNAGDDVNVVWHPNTATLNVIQDETKYFSEIKIESGAKGPRVYSDNKASLTTFLGTAPSSVEVKRTANQSRSGYAYAGDYMYINYAAESNAADILTVLFPGDKTHQAGEMTRIESGDYSGSEITQGDVVDVALTSGGTSVGQQGAKSFQGEDIFYRSVSKRLSSYFVKGISFDNGQSIRVGFEADNSVVLYMNASSVATGMSGMISSNGTEVTFYYPEISSVIINGNTASVISSGSNWIKVETPSGTSTLELVSESTIPLQISSPKNSFTPDFNYSRSDHKLTISTTDVPNFKVEVFSLRGQELSSSESCNSTYTLCLDDMPKGIYLVRVRSGSNFGVRKLLVY